MMRIALNAYVTGDEMHVLDGVLKACGFQNRTDFMTACIEATIYGDSPGCSGLPLQFREWAAGVRAAAACRDRLLETAIAVFDELAFAVVAMRGCEVAFSQVRAELEEAIFERCGMVPGREDLRNFLRVYSRLRRPALLEYRRSELARMYAERREEGGVE